MLKLEPFSPADFQQLESYLKDANTDNASKYIFKAVDELTNEVIGHISLGNIDRMSESARIGKVLIGRTESRGNGYGAQLMLAALK